MPAPHRDDERLVIGRQLVGRRIREARQTAELTLPEVAEATSVSAGYISDCERGHKLPSLPTLMEIATVCGVLTTDFLEGAYPFGERQPPSPDRLGRDRSNERAQHSLDDE